MIDWSAVYRDGLVVTCRSVEESRAFWRDIKDVFREYDIETNRSWIGQIRHIEYRHNNYSDGCVSYDLIICDGEIDISWCNEEYYRNTVSYQHYEFVDYRTGNCSQSDLGDLEVDGAADISLLFLGEVLT